MMGKILFMRKGEIHTAPIVYIDSISIKKAPNKTSYTVGQSFDPTGMIVEAHYKDGRIVEITGYTIVNGNSLSLGQTSVTISYTENGVTKTATQAITVVKSLGSLAIGDIVYLKENGTPVEYLIVNKGNPDSNLYDSSCDGIWLLRKSLVNGGSFGETNYLENSPIQRGLASTMLSAYDQDVQNTIKQVKIPYRKGGGVSGTNMYGAAGFSCKVFMLSVYELGYTNSYDSNYPVDGAVLSYFKNAPLSTRIGLFNGRAALWWLRSPYTSTNFSECLIKANGGSGFGTVSEYSVHVRPALIMPSDTAVNDDNSIG